jgi:AraC-like DNA-binding protein
MGQDTLSDLLRSVRLKGAMFFYVDCVEPWVTAAPDASVMAPAVMPDSEHLMEYHMVVRGHCWAAAAGEPRVQVHQGDVIVFPHGDAHMLSSAPDLRAEPDIDSLFEWRPPQLPFLLRQGMARQVVASVADTASEQTGLLCGFLGCDRRPFNPLLATLPKMIHAPASDHEADTWIAQFVRLAVDESRHKRPGGEAVLERMSEMMFVDLLRRYLETLPDDDRSWLAGLRDRYVGRVLGLMHEAPAETWTLERLSDRVGLSRSALHERFVQFIGVPPMQYLTRWRMQVASRLLAEGNATLASVALEVGYESDAAFSRAFKRAVGVPPAKWRRRRTAVATNDTSALADDRQGQVEAERSPFP